MEEVKKVMICPLGMKGCQYIEDNVEHQCMWYIKLQGQDPQDAEKVYDEWGCAIAWQPILQCETARTNRGQTEALNSFRDEVVGVNQKIRTLPELKEEVEE